jgi:squalene-associated FAD-dependent desaturase
MHVAIIGGGLAGLAAGCELSDHGHNVEIFESRPWLGGSTYSFTTPKELGEVDNGQHIFMNCTTAYTDFLKRLGTLHLTKQQKLMRIAVFDKKGQRSDIRTTHLPTPLHLTPSLISYKHLTLRQKNQIARILVKLKLGMTSKSHGEESFDSWLRNQGQSDQIIKDFWDFLMKPILNCTTSEASTTQAFFVIKRGLLSTKNAMAIGLPTVGLNTLHIEPAKKYIEDRNGKVQTRSKVEELIINNGHVEGMNISGKRVKPFDAYICALPPWCVQEILPKPWQTKGSLNLLRAFKPSPIMNIHIWYDQPVANFEFAASLSDNLQWIFNQTKINGKETIQEHLVISISAPTDLFNLTKPEVLQAILPELNNVLPKTRTANIRNYLVIKEPFATFIPSVRLKRPGPTTPLDNFFLAGTYTDTQWPATMESAVQSGHNAVNALENALQKPDLSQNNA